MMWHHGGNWDGFFPMMFGGGIMMIVFWGLVIWLIVYLVRRSSNEKPYPKDQAIDILRQRYSRGEISTEEYRERLAELKDSLNV
ncbi:SHOCT domain-containing protein [Virgibacillus soli]|uniref:SHOCT domain-containing protein n=1 Tax=Paracerasibacillus soli TaxID=480284 RepID=A0ABU5CWL9_9BACI|nr:SHOCT domain-containing protein [Virgibacillus soli]MDY0410234.1 SHOCT domain-containing protein [Virgibacillus soli]